MGYVVFGAVVVVICLMSFAFVKISDRFRPIPISHTGMRFFDIQQLHKVPDIDFDIYKIIFKSWCLVLNDVSNKNDYTCFCNLDIEGGLVLNFEIEKKRELVLPESDSFTLIDDYIKLPPFELMSFKDESVCDRFLVILDESIQKLNDKQQLRIDEIKSKHFLYQSGYGGCSKFEGMNASMCFFDD